MELKRTANAMIFFFFIYININISFFTVTEKEIKSVFPPQIEWVRRGGYNIWRALNIKYYIIESVFSFAENVNPVAMVAVEKNRPRGL